jgi:hypothetical protein
MQTTKQKRESDWEDGDTNFQIIFESTLYEKYQRKEHEVKILKITNL